MPVGLQTQGRGERQHRQLARQNLLRAIVAFNTRRELLRQQRLMQFGIKFSIAPVRVIGLRIDGGATQQRPKKLSGSLLSVAQPVRVKS